MNKPAAPSFKISPHVLVQLGAELISDAPQAILELIKNSYDAGSEDCVINISTKEAGEIEKEIETEEMDEKTGEKKTKIIKIPYAGAISVTDSGCGMSESDIHDGWLYIAKSRKSDIKKSGEIPLNGRSPLGDKGLGRLATMKLGRFVEVTTWDGKSTDAYRITLDWEECVKAESIEQANVKIKVIHPSKTKKGTKTEIFQLNDAEFWETQDKLAEFSLKKLMSQFPNSKKTENTFSLKINLNGLNVECDKIDRKILEKSMLQFTFFSLSYDNLKENEYNEITVDVLVKKSYFEGSGKKEFGIYVAPDNGAALIEYLKEKKFKNMIFEGNPNKWPLRITMKTSWREWEEIGEGHLAETLSPGPFMGEIFTFRRAQGRPFASGSVNINKTLNEIGGVSVFRDEFKAISGKTDWLRLGDSWSSGKSYYGLQPKNTIGYIHLTVKDNGDVKEKSDREGFTDTPHSRGFFRICNEIVKMINDQLATRLGRGYVEFCKECSRKIQEKSFGNPPQSALLNDVIDKQKEIISDARNGASAAQRASHDAAEAIATVSEEVRSLNIENNKKEFILNAQGNASRKIQDIERELGKVKEACNDAALSWIKSKVDDLYEQVKELNETVGLGIAASSLVHEIDPFAKEIITRSDKIRNKSSQLSPSEIDIPLWSNSIKSYTQTIQKKIGFLNPMMRAFREMKESINLEEYLMEYFKNRKDTVVKNEIDYVVKNDKKTEIRAFINRGRLFQVIDNLTRNSEYWLTITRRPAPTITATIEDGSIIFEDNGPGVDKNYEDVLFDLFISSRKNGHGIGLYLVDEIMSDNGGSISLLPDRNQNERRYRFKLDFTGIPEK